MIETEANKRWKWLVQPLEVHLIRGVWIYFAGALVVKAFICPLSHSVYDIYRVGTDRWWAGLPLHEFLLDRQDMYRYSPTFAILFTPFNMLPLSVGEAIWAVMNVLVLYFSLKAFLKDLLPSPQKEKWSSWQIVFFHYAAFFVSLMGLWSNQINSLLLSFLIFGCSAMLRRRWWLAAALLAFPVYVKIWPIAAAMLLLCVRPKEMIWRFVLMMIAFGLFPFLTKPPSVVVMQYQQWYESLLTVQQRRWPGIRDAWTLWECLYPPVSLFGYRLVQLGSAFAAFVGTLWIVRTKSKTISEGAMLGSILSLWAAWQLLFGPGTEQLTYGLIAPTLAWAVVESFRLRRHRLWTLVTLAVVAFMTMGSIEKVFLDSIPLAKAAAPLGILSFVVWFLLASPVARPEKQ